MNILQSERDHIKLLFNNGAFILPGENKAFESYTSGTIGPYYVKSENVMRSGTDYSRVIRDISSMVKEALGFRKNLDYVVSGGERRDWFFSSPTAIKLKKPHLAIRKDGIVMGPNVDGRYVVHVADLDKKGSSPRKLWVPTIRGMGGDIRHIFFYIECDEGGENEMEGMGLRSHNLVFLNGERWMYMLAQGMISQDTYEEVMEYRDNSSVWAKKVLESEKGLNQLLGMMNGVQEDRVKAEKIMDFYGLSLKEMIKNHNSLTM